MIFVLWYAIMQCPRDFHSQKKREREKTKTNSWDKWRSPNGWDDGSPKRAGEDKRANLDSYTCTHKRTLATWIHVSSREGDQGAYTWESHSLRCSDKGGNNVRVMDGSTSGTSDLASFSSEMIDDCSFSFQRVVQDSSRANLLYECKRNVCVGSSLPIESFN